MQASDTLELSNLERLIHCEPLLEILEAFISHSEGARLANCSPLIHVKVFLPAPWLREPRFNSLRGVR